MIEINNDSPRVDKIKGRLRSEIDFRRGGSAISYACTPGSGSELLARLLANLHNELGVAVDLANVATTLPAMGRFHGWKRRVALFTGRVVLYLSQVVMIGQRQFNFRLLDWFRDMCDGLANVQVILATLEEENTKMKAELLELTQAVRRLEEQLPQSTKIKTTSAEPMQAA